MTTQIYEQFRTVGTAVVWAGLVLCAGGNLSTRISRDEYSITASGVDLDKVGPNDVVRVPIDSNDPVIRASSEWKMHSAIYRERPDINAVVHLHSQSSVLADMAGLSVPLMTLDHASYVGRTASASFAPNGSWQLANVVALAARSADLVVMAHHGVCSMGSSLRDAYRRAVNYEQAAEMAIRLRLIGVNNIENPFDDPTNRLHM